jgi:lipopolysaccharide biosynthesis protein
VQSSRPGLLERCRHFLAAGYRHLPLPLRLKRRVRLALDRPIGWTDSQIRARRSAGGAHPPLGRGTDGPRVRLLESFVTSLFSEPNESYVPFDPKPIPLVSVRLVAFYLPQFHRIPENDRWWGRGFTEWTNVVRGRPQFVGHNQPRLPGELGFYDLRLVEVQRRQIELARLYGLHGFCFHHYWFGGKRLLDLPFSRTLCDKTLDLPFCLCWANENWTRRWDGLDDEVLMAQRYSPDDDLAFIKDIERALQDERYIRVNGRPLLIVYRPALLPDPKATAERWRRHCRRAGVGDLYLVSTHSFDRFPPDEMGFDAAMEFSPNNCGAPSITSKVGIVNPHYAGNVFDYRFLVAQSANYKVPRYRLHRTVAPDWDNDARKPGRGNTFVNSTPSLYAQWLENACRHTARHFPESERIVFINAWNEWAESAYLEPDRRYGYAYLEATAEALRRAAANPGPTTQVD